MCNPIEAEMDEAIENARAAHGLGNFDFPCPSDLRVKQKYIGHRNARWDLKKSLLYFIIMQSAAS